MFEFNCLRFFLWSAVFLLGADLLLALANFG